MNQPVRLGAVAYLNAQPLVHGLGPGVSVRFDVPSVCATLLARGEIDLGLIPTIAYFDRPGDRIVPGVSIASDGEVASVALFARQPVREIRTIALDTSSRTSVVLTRILCARRFEIAPTFVPHAPDLSAMLAACDAALLIGDPALFADLEAVGSGRMGKIAKIDLGLAWRDLTGLPFVWAVWAGGPEGADPTVVEALARARDAGVAQSDAIADAYCAHEPSHQPVARRYLRENMRYGLTGPMLEGLNRFFEEAAVLDLAPRSREIGFFAASERTNRRA